MKFPHDAPRQKVLKTLESLDFLVIRTGNHISLARTNADGSITPMTIPNHPKIKSSTLRTICNQGGISRDEFVKRYEMS